MGGPPQGHTTGRKAGAQQEFREGTEPAGWGEAGWSLAEPREAPRRSRPFPRPLLGQAGAGCVQGDRIPCRPHPLPVPLASGGHGSCHSGRPEPSCTASCKTWPLTGMTLRPTGRVGKTEFTGSNGSEGNHHPTRLHHCWGHKRHGILRSLGGSWPRFYSAYTQGCRLLEQGMRAAAWIGGGRVPAPQPQQCLWARTDGKQRV